MVSGCLKNQKVNEYFSQSFLNNNLLKILPDGYDVCYEITILDDNIMNVVFYLYDSEAPMTDIDSKYIVGSISTYIDRGEDLEINISSLGVNETLNGFNLRKAGFGTYLLLIAISYAKSLDIENIKLDDMSDGYRTEHNIYKRIGLEYEDEDGGPEMIGFVDEVYSNLNGFLEKYSSKIINKLDDLTEYFYDDEWDEEEWYDDKEEDEEYEYYMDMDGGVGTPPPPPPPPPPHVERAINARNRWLSDMRRRFQESVQSGQPDMELAQIIMRNTPIDQSQVRAIPMSNRGIRLNERRTLGRNIIPSSIRQTNTVPLVRLVRPGEDISHLQMMHAELVPKKDSLDSPPDSPDRNRQRREAARDIQRRFRGNRQRRKLTKNRPRFGKMQEPATEREHIRRWIDLSNQFDPDDPVKGYLNPFTKKNSKKTMKKYHKKKQ
jgi:hypothetical protein